MEAGPGTSINHLSSFYDKRKSFGKSFGKGLTNVGGMPHNRYISNSAYVNTRLAGSPTEMRKQMEIGQVYTTAKSGVQGTVAEIVKNSNGSSRVRLTLSNGDSRWTTVK